MKAWWYCTLTDQWYEVDIPDLVDPEDILRATLNAWRVIQHVGPWTGELGRVRVIGDEIHAETRHERLKCRCNLGGPW